MNEEKIQADSQERDLLDGGFAVVDREKIIEEETRFVTPWYKHFINVFLDPRKMMEENFYHEPPKGLSIGIVGSILFTAIMLLLTYANPIMKQQVFDSFRMNGIAEEMIAQKYAITQMSVVIGGIISIFVGGLITAVILQVAKLIAKDKGKFGSLFTTALLSNMVAAALMSIDKLIALFIPTTTTVLGLPILLSEDLLASNIPLMVIAQILTLPSIASLVILVIGYSVVARVSTKKSLAVVASVEVFFILVSMGIAYVGQMMAQNIQPPM
ncbi:MAG: hypothetical protein K0S71_3024 [Clostridia bacterium]|jgi:hypothetical protein|nr:hypothetical protein [Clostridia bacterium]